MHKANSATSLRCMAVLLAALMLTLGFAVTTQAVVVTLFEAGFETSEGYTDSSDGSDELLIQGYLGDTGNQQGWYGEQYYGKSADHVGVVTDDMAHRSVQRFAHVCPRSFQRARCCR